MDFISASAGGLTFHLGRDMKTSHKGMGIDQDDYTALKTPGGDREVKLEKIGRGEQDASNKEVSEEYWLDMEVSSTGTQSPTSPCRRVLFSTRQPSTS
ncbi:MAG: hypothetical protein WCA59_20270 [Candidatus Binataceae bacterium]